MWSTNRAPSPSNTCLNDWPMLPKLVPILHNLLPHSNFCHSAELWVLQQFTSSELHNYVASYTWTCSFEGCGSASLWLWKLDPQWSMAWRILEHWDGQGTYRSSSRFCEIESLGEKTELLVTTGLGAAAIIMSSLKDDMELFCGDGL